jgi:hypothetical protein
MSDMICTACGSATKPKTITKGSTLIELILWLCFIVPGIIYSIWRLSSRYSACRACGSKNIVPLDTPVGRGLAQTYHPEKQTDQISGKSGAENIGRALGRTIAKLKKN